jgi:hypothetical protein
MLLVHRRWRMLNGLELTAYWFGSSIAALIGSIALFAPRFGPAEVFGLAAAVSALSGVALRTLWKRHRSEADPQPSAP